MPAPPAVMIARLPVRSSFMEASPGGSGGADCGCGNDSRRAPRPAIRCRQSDVHRQPSSPTWRRTLRRISSMSLPLISSPATTKAKARPTDDRKIGRASCRESVCQYVSISVVAVTLKKKQDKHKHTQEKKKNK